MGLPRTASRPWAFLRPAISVGSQESDPAQNRPLSAERLADESVARLAIAGPSPPPPVEKECLVEVPLQASVAARRSRHLAAPEESRRVPCWAEEVNLPAILAVVHPSDRLAQTTDPA